MEMDPVRAKHFCQSCSISFTRNSHLKRHMRTQHGYVFEEDSRLSRLSLHCPLCSDRFSTRALTEDHITTFHDTEIVKKDFTFYTEEDFTDWKRKTERAESCTFVSTKGESILSDGRMAKYFHCHRCGTYEPTVKGQRKRRLKSNGTIKTGAYCPARIKRFTTVVEEAMEITVEYVSTHIGHGKDMFSPRSVKRKSWSNVETLEDSVQKLMCFTPVLRNLQHKVATRKRTWKSTNSKGGTKAAISIKPSVSNVLNLNSDQAILNSAHQVRDIEILDERLQGQSNQLRVLANQRQTNLSDIHILPSHENQMENMPDDVNAKLEVGNSVIYLYQSHGEDDVPQWANIEGNPQELDPGSMQVAKNVMDSMAKRKECLISMLQVVASKIDNATCDQHFDVLDRYVMALINHLDSFMVPSQMVQDNVTYQVLS